MATMSAAVRVKTSRVRSENTQEDNQGWEHFYRFCNETSLHGWSYLATERGLCRKLLWLAATLTANVFALYFTYRNIVEYANSTTITSINTTTASLTDIFFPSVVTCNVNQVSRAFLMSINVTNETEAGMLYDHFVEGNVTRWEIFEQEGRNYSEWRGRLNDIKPQLEMLKQKYNWSDKVSFTKLANQKCPDLMLSTTWKNNYTVVFYDAYQVTSDYGVCCSIVPYLDFTNPETSQKSPSTFTYKDYHGVPRGTKNGIQNGLKLMIDAESFDYAYYYRGAKGFKMVLVDHRDKPVVNQDGIYLAPGTEQLIAIVPKVYNTTVEAIDKFDPKWRNCYTDPEFDLENMSYNKSFRYAMKNCLYEAVLEKIIENCTCKPTFVNFVLTGDLETNLESCSGVRLGCMQHWMNNFGSESNPRLLDARDVNHNEMQCRPSCEHQTQEIISTASDYPNRKLLEYRRDYCIIMLKIHRICQNENKRQTLENTYKDKGHVDICKNVTDFVKKKVCDQNGHHVTSPQYLTEDGSDPMDLFIQEYASNNVAVVKIFVKDPYYVNYKKDVEMTLTSFIGNAGGLMGLCLGLSFISIFEVFYHIVNACASRLCRATTLVERNVTSVQPQNKF